MSKQVNRVNVEPEILLYFSESIFFVNPFPSCKTDIIICNNTL